MAAAQVLLRYQPVEAESNTIRERWLHELIDLAGKAHIGCRKTTTQGTLGGSSKVRAQPSSQQLAASSTAESPDLRSRIDEIWASKDVSVTPRRSREHIVERKKVVPLHQHPDLLGNRLRTWAPMGRDAEPSRQSSAGLIGPPSSGQISMRSTTTPSIPRSSSRSTLQPFRPRVEDLMSWPNTSTSPSRGWRSHGW